VISIIEPTLGHMSSTNSKKFKGPLAATAMDNVISGDLAWSSWIPGWEITTCT
jgi:hypothetical protein